jgi:hypothetical protein
MACTCAPALKKLRSEIDHRWPGRDKASDGCCGDAAHAARRSDHNPTGGYAHALDIDENLSPETGSLTWLAPVLLADDRAKYVIYEGRIYHARCRTHGADCFARGGHRYTGANAHAQHLHLSIRAGTTHDTRPWLNGRAHPTSEEDDMPTVDEIVKALKPVIRAEANAAVLEVLRSEGVPENAKRAEDHAQAARRMIRFQLERAGESASTVHTLDNPDQQAPSGRR